MEDLKGIADYFAVGGTGCITGGCLDPFLVIFSRLYSLSL